MSVRALIQVGIQLESFRNINLPKQGFYQLRIRLYHEAADSTKV
jgi:hypothetical protein